jgi:hypothetical protein
LISSFRRSCGLWSSVARSSRIWFEGCHEHIARVGWSEAWTPANKEGIGFTRGRFDRAQALNFSLQSRNLLL